MKLNKAFTLIELLVVLIVLTVLVGVGVPKFARMLESQKTNEAEEVFSAVRTEQEKRCIMGKNYYAPGQENQVALLNGGASQHYEYRLLSSGIEADRTSKSSGKDYKLRMWYKTGEVCCAGGDCGSLSKDYPDCPQEDPSDECAAEIASVPPPPPPNPCQENPQQCGCEPFTSQHKCICDADFAAQNKQFCCSQSEYKQMWPELCKDPCEDSSYVKAHKEACCSQSKYKQMWPDLCKDPCTDCSCEEYAAAHPEECKPCEDCSCEEYAAEHPKECQKKDCNDDEYFASNTKECCLNGSNRDECFEYTWDKSIRKGARRYGFYKTWISAHECVNLSDHGGDEWWCNSGRDWEWPLESNCRVISGNITLGAGSNIYDRGEFFSVAAENRTSVGNPGGKRCFSFSTAACDKQHANQQVSVKCEAFLQELGPEFTWYFNKVREYTLYDATISYMCKRQRKDFSGSNKNNDKQFKVCNQ